MGNIYGGFGGHKTHMGHCENGIIYSGSGTRNPIGRYQNGSIYNQFKEHIGSYDGGSIYDRSGKHIGSYEGGIVYNQYLNAVAGREQVGSYEDDPAEAAALILLFIGESAANENNADNSVISSGSSLWDMILGLLTVVIMFIWKLLAPIIVYYTMPMQLNPTWLGAILGILGLVLSSNGLTGLGLFLVLITLIPRCAFLPLWIMLIVHRLRKQINRADYARFCWKWFLKGHTFTIGLFEILFKWIRKQKQWTDVVDYYKNWFYEVGLG